MVAPTTSLLPFDFTGRGSPEIIASSTSDVRDDHAINGDAIAGAHQDAVAALQGCDGNLYGIGGVVSVHLERDRG